MAISRVSYSQVAEDLLAAFYLRRDSDITCVDVGCLWPVQHSNTYMFYSRGGSGVCIDPNTTVRSAYEETRPRDQFFNCGVSQEAGFLDYFQFANPVFNTFSPARALELHNSGRKGRALVAQTSVEVLPLRDILLKADWRGKFGATIDFLSIDVEGKELDVISSIDFSYARPQLIVMETAVKTEKQNGILAQRLLLDMGYRICGETGHDTFFRDGAA